MTYLETIFTGLIVGILIFLVGLLIGSQFIMAGVR